MVKVFLGNMPYNEEEVNQEEIRDMFRKYGTIDQVIVKKGYGFLEFAEQHDADDACREMDGVEYLGKKLRVSLAFKDDERKKHPRHNSGGYSRGEKSDPRSNSLFVANIPPDTTYERLKDFFEKFGQVENVKVLPQSSNNPNISAFVDFTEYSAAVAAHEADLKFEGKFLRTDFSTNRRNKTGRNNDDRRDDRGRYGDNRGRDDRRRDHSPAPRSSNRSRSRDRSRGRRDDRSPPRRRDDRRSPPRDDRRDDRRSAPRDDRRDDRRSPPRDDRRSPTRGDRRDNVRDDRRDPPRDDRRDPPRDDRRDTRNDRSPPRNNGRASSPQRSWSRGRSPARR